MSILSSIFILLLGVVRRRCWSSRFWLSLDWLTLIFIFELTTFHPRRWTKDLISYIHIVSATYSGIFHFPNILIWVELFAHSTSSCRSEIFFCKFSKHASHVGLVTTLQQNSKKHRMRNRIAKTNKMARNTNNPIQCKEI